MVGQRKGFPVILASPPPQGSPHENTGLTALPGVPFPRPDDGPGAGDEVFSSLAWSGADLGLGVAGGLGLLLLGTLLDKKDWQWVKNLERVTQDLTLQLFGNKRRVSGAEPRPPPPAPPWQAGCLGPGRTGVLHRDGRFRAVDASVFVRYRGVGNDACSVGGIYSRVAGDGSWNVATATQELRGK